MQIHSRSKHALASGVSALRPCARSAQLVIVVVVGRGAAHCTAVRAAHAQRPVVDSHQLESANEAGLSARARDAFAAGAHTWLAYVGGLARGVRCGVHCGADRRADARVQRVCRLARVQRG